MQQQILKLFYIILYSEDDTCTFQNNLKTEIALKIVSANRRNKVKPNVRKVNDSKNIDSSCTSKEGNNFDIAKNEIEQLAYLLYRDMQKPKVSAALHQASNNLTLANYLPKSFV